MDGVWRKLLLLLIRATATDDVAYGQNNNVSDPTCLLYTSDAADE